MLSASVPLAVKTNRSRPSDSGTSLPHQRLMLSLSVSTTYTFIEWGDLSVQKMNISFNFQYTFKSDNKIEGEKKSLNYFIYRSGTKY